MYLFLRARRLQSIGLVGGSWCLPRTMALFSLFPFYHDVLCVNYPFPKQLSLVFASSRIHDATLHIGASKALGHTLSWRGARTRM